MNSVKFQGKQRFCNRLQFEHPAVMVRFRINAPPDGASGKKKEKAISSKPRKPTIQVKVDVGRLQFNTGTYFLVAKMHMFQRLFWVCTR